MEPEETKDEKLSSQNETLIQNPQEQSEQKIENNQSEQQDNIQGSKTTKKKFKWWIVVLIVLGCCGIGLAVYFIFFNPDTMTCPKGESKRCNIIGDEKECYCSTIGECDFSTGHGCVDIAKPIIYLYPQTTTEISVQLGHPEKITVSYPKYNNGWKVLAEPSGNLTEISSGKRLYSLYWEGKDSTLKTTDEGFVIPGNQTAEFLDEKLAILGLNDYEREEFIIYWLPKMQDNNYNYIRFATDAEIEENMPLEITPKPDTTIRVMMIVEPLDNYKEINEQTLTPKVRNGYTAVEWGGSIYNDATTY